jgi:outer membrane protein assembly factor BamA
VIRLAAVVIAVVIASTGVASAQPDPAPLAPGVRWTEWTLVGTMLEPATKVRAMLEPTMQQRRVLDEKAEAEIKGVCQVLGYHLIRIDKATVGSGTLATLVVAPIPVIRSVNVTTRNAPFGVLLDDEIGRRMRLRTGQALPVDQKARRDEEILEEQRIEEFLRDEGFFEAKADLDGQEIGDYGIRMNVEVDLGPAYELGFITVDDAAKNPDVTPGEIRAQFVQQRQCLVWKICWGRARFTRAQHNRALLKVIDLYRKRGYPAVRVQSFFDPKTSFFRKERKVRFTVRVDQRRQIDVVFEGNDKVRFKDEDLKKQLTFNEAASSDDFEAASSAAALALYYQSKGRFDAQVTAHRERFRDFDRIIFRIDEGTTRQVRSVSFSGNRTVPAADLAGVVTIRPYRTIRVFGSNATASAPLLAADAEKIRRAYHDRGFLDARVAARVSPDRGTLDSAALTAAVLASDRAKNDLHVQFDIVEGARTDVGEIWIILGKPGAATTPTDDDRARCDQAIDHLVRTLRTTATARHALPNGCAATLEPLAMREEQLRGAGESMRDWFWSQGRLRTTVGFKLDRENARRYRALAIFAVDVGHEQHLGKIAVRGNFRTRESVILGELGFSEGELLTASKLASGPRAVRATGLFDSVNVDLIDETAAPDSPVHAVVRVEERYDARFQFDVEAGLSTQNGYFVKEKTGVPNMFGTGTYSEAAVTLGSRYIALELAGRLPRWMARRMFPVGFDTELTAYYRIQDTERFGELTTQGASVAALRSWERPRTETRDPRVITASLRYDFRVRNREEDALRPAGPDADQDQVPVTTRTGSIGIGLRWDGRVDRRGVFNPLATERGMLVDGLVSLASPYLLGQDTFVKVSGAIQRYWPIGSRVLVRTDLRVDQGFPLGDTVLLPEVERFFAGGDNTVRGFDEDRLETEIIEVDVPPIDGLTQIRVLPAGGNIRAISSLDAQLSLIDRPDSFLRAIATAAFIDAGMVRNRWAGIEPSDIRPGVGVALRLLSPVGTVTVEYAFPLLPRLGDDPRGRFHFGLAFRQ